MNEEMSDIERHGFAQALGLRRIATSPKYALRFFAVIAVLVAAILAIVFAH